MEALGRVQKHNEDLAALLRLLPKGKTHNASRVDASLAEERSTPRTCENGKNNETGDEAALSQMAIIKLQLENMHLNLQSANEESKFLRNKCEKLQNELVDAQMEVVRLQRLVDISKQKKSEMEIQAKKAEEYAKEVDEKSRAVQEELESLNSEHTNYARMVWVEKVLRMRLILKDIKAVGQRRYYHTKRDTLNGWFRKAVGARRLPAAESIAGAYVADSPRHSRSPSFSPPPTAHHLLARSSTPMHSTHKPVNTLERLIHAYRPAPTNADPPAYLASSFVASQRGSPERDSVERAQEVASRSHSSHDSGPLGWFLQQYGKDSKELGVHMTPRREASRDRDRSRSPDHLRLQADRQSLHDMKRDTPRSRGSQVAGAFAGFTFRETHKGDACLPAAADAMLTGACEDSQASTLALTCPVRQWSPPTQTTWEKVEQEPVRLSFSTGIVPNTGGIVPNTGAIVPNTGASLTYSDSEVDPRALSGLQADKRATLPLPLTPLPLTPLLPRPLSFSVPSAQAFSQAQWARQQLEDKLNLESPRDATTPRGQTRKPAVLKRVPWAQN